MFKSDILILKPKYFSKSFQLHNINGALATNQIIQLLIIEHKQPFLLNDFSQSFSYISCLMLETFVNFVSGQQSYVKTFVLTNIARNFTWLRGLDGRLVIVGCAFYAFRLGKGMLGKAMMRLISCLLCITGSCIGLGRSFVNNRMSSFFPRLRSGMFLKIYIPKLCFRI